MSATTIRDVESADFDAIASLTRASDAALSTDYATRRIREAPVGLVATSGEKVIGYVALDYSFYGNGFIPVLFVAEAARRSGVGTSLIQAVERRCKTSKLFTSTNQSNTPMLSLLARVGFEPSGIIHNLDEGDPEMVYFRLVNVRTG